jgi:hypothetical protein
MNRLTWPRAGPAAERPGQGGASETGVAEGGLVGRVGSGLGASEERCAALGGHRASGEDGRHCSGGHDAPGRDLGKIGDPSRGVDQCQQGHTLSRPVSGDERAPVRSCLHPLAAQAVHPGRGGQAGFLRVPDRGRRHF